MRTAPRLSGLEPERAKDTSRVACPGTNQPWGFTTSEVVETVLTGTPSLRRRSPSTQRPTYSEVPAPHSSTHLRGWARNSSRNGRAAGRKEAKRS